MIETLLSAGLVLLVMLLGINFLLPLLGMQQKGGERAELQQRSATLVEELRQDLSHSNGAGVTLVSSPTEVLLAIHPAADMAQDGTLVWADQLIVYQWRREDRLWQRALWKDAERKLLQAGRPSRLAEADLRHVVSQVAQSPTRVIGGLELAQVGHSGASASVVTLPLTLRLSLVSPTGERRQVSCTLGGRLPRA